MRVRARLLLLLLLLLLLQSQRVLRVQVGVCGGVRESRGGRQRVAVAATANVAAAGRRGCIGRVRIVEGVLLRLLVLLA